jgi:N-methylhydantoinase A/oxoprolinase/acetone carboxylase beta subunit
MGRAELRIGLDVGTTHADGVLMDERDRVLHRAKRPASTDLRATLAAVVADLVRGPGTDPAGIRRVMLTTTGVPEARLRRRDLRRVAIVRIGGPPRPALPPLATWPGPLRAAVDGGVAVVGGGVEYDGTVTRRLDRDAIARFLGAVAEQAQAVALTAVFASTSSAQELEAAEVARAVLDPATPISLSHELGSPGLLGRENATILNAALGGTAEQLACDLFAAAASAGVAAEPFFTQHDGTLMSLEHAIRFPVLLTATGPSSALRGAAWLSGLAEGLVVDVGGRETRIGALVGGAPRESARRAQVEGVRMDFRPPELRRLPFGGNSLVAVRAGLATIEAAFGPGLAFGGHRPALIDAALAAEAGNRDDPGGGVLALVGDRMADGVDRVRGGGDPGPLIVVGGAGQLVPAALEGVSQVVRLPDGAVAGAVGAAVAPFSAQAYRICANRPDDRRRALDEARADAVARAVHAGADPAALELSEIEEVPLTAMVDPVVRIRVKIAGPHG